MREEYRASANNSEKVQCSFLQQKYYEIFHFIVRGKYHASADNSEKVQCSFLQQKV
jgi:hypothetical protein